MQLQNSKVLKFINREVNTFQMGLWVQRIQFHWPISSLWETRKEKGRVSFWFGGMCWWLWLELPAHKVLAFLQQVGQRVMALTSGVRVTSLAPLGHQCAPTGKKRGGIKRLSIPVMYLIYSLSFRTGLNLPLEEESRSWVLFCFFLQRCIFSLKFNLFIVLCFDHIRS